MKFTATIYIYAFIAFIFLVQINIAQGQNVGIGTATPMEKLHINGNIQVDGLASADTNVVLSNFDGKLINLNAGNAGEVLTSQGAGRAPIWAAAGAATPTQDKIHFMALTGAPSVACSPSSASTLTLLTHTFTPANDTVIFNFSSEGRISSTVTLAAQAHTYVFRVIVNGSSYRQTYFDLVHNGAGGVTSAFLPANFSMPVPVTAGASNTIQVQVITMFTISGTLTLTYDTSAFTQYATSTIYDFKTN
jgi:hypothetical protein